MFTIQDGRSKFYQWDKGRKLIVKDSTISEVHFSNGVVGCALVCETYTEDGKTFANVPNILLTSDLPVAVYAYSADYTKHSARFKVHPRPKPADYVYTETEIWTAEKAVEKALAEAKANGDFKGDKGDKGDPGAIEFIVVSELPAEGDGSAIYLLPSADGADQNAYDEFIFNAGEWEKIGSASVAVDLNDYVKNTDYASADVAGVVKVGNGLTVNPKSNALGIVGATEQQIAEKLSNQQAITPQRLDYAVKVGVTTNAIELTDVEKTAACEWLGAVGTTDYATKDAAGVIKVNNGYGLSVNKNTGMLDVMYAAESEIDSKHNYRAINAAKIDYAVKVGITTNTETLTDEEKAAARVWLGAVGETDFPDTKNFKAGVIRVDNYYGFNIGQAGSAGVLLPLWASNAEIDAKSDRRFINPSNFAYALEKSLATSAYIADLEARIAALEGGE